MTVYALFLREGAIHDQSEMAAYQAEAAKGDRSAFNMTPLVGYGAMEALEGEAPDGIVLLQFPTIEDAKAWYNSDAYQAAIPHRKKAADYRVVLVEGF